MKNQKLLKNLRHRLSLLLCLMAVLVVGQSAWGTTYYVYGKTTSNSESTIKGWNSPVATANGDASQFSFSLDVSDCTVNTDYYISVNRNSNGFLPNGGSSNDWNDHIICGNAPATGSISGGQYGVTINNNCSFQLLRFKRTASSVTKINFNVEKNNSSSYYSCSCSQNQWTYNMSANASTITWALVGEFNNWSKTANVFAGTGDRLTTTLLLPAHKSYVRSATGGKTGFKVLKVVDGNEYWFGCNTTINKSITNYEFKTSYTDNCGLTTCYGGEYVFTLHNLGGDPQLDLPFPTIPPTVPIVRWGDKPVDNNKAITTSAYIAAQGCDGTNQQTVSNIRVRFWKENEEANAQIIEYGSSSYTINNVYTKDIPADNDILMSCVGPTKIYMEVSGYNPTGWSDYSDRIAMMYQSGNEFWVNSLERTFNACEGGHQFTLSEMVKPVPDTWSAKVKSSSADATEDFTLNNGIMVWNVDGKITGETYTFTFNKDGYDSKTADLAITFSGESTTSEITSISISPSTKITPWVEVILTPTIVGSDIESVEWSVSPSTLVVANDDNTATFKGKAAGTYTVTAVGLTENCGKTAPKSVPVVVEADEEYCE